MEKLALITGASKGIGKSLAEVFASHGYSLLLVARNSAELQQIQADLQLRYKISVKILSVDLAAANRAEIILNTFKDELHEVEVLVNNAGFGLTGKLDGMSAQEVTGMLAVNIVALTELTHRILPFMLANKHGKVLNVASTAAFGPGPYMAIYYATKSYVLSFSEALYAEYRNQGIVVSTLCPGVTKTNFMQRSGLDKTLLTKLSPGMTPERVADIAFSGLMKSKRIIVPGVMNKVTKFLMWLTPSFIVAKITGMLEKPRT